MPRSPRTGNLSIFIDETGSDGNSEVLGVALVSTEQPEEMRSRLQHLRSTLNLDPHLSGIVRTIRKKRRFHFTDDSQFIRGPVIETLRDLPFRAYVALALRERLPCDAEWNWYATLLQKLLTDRLRANKHKAVFIGAEGVADRHRDALIRHTIETAVAASERIDGRHFEQPPRVEIIDKTEDCLVAVDYVAGVVREFAERSSTGRDTTKVNFLRLRPRIRLIHDVPGRRFYDSRSEFRGSESLLRVDAGGPE